VSLFFVDSSALLKRYVPEVGTTWVRSWIELQAGNIVLIAEVAIIECVAALARRQREGTVATSAFTHLRNDFLLHASYEYLVVLVHTPILKAASELVARHPLRTLDAIQLACASESRHALGEVPIFISADTNLLQIASAEGFPVDNPRLHP
jgi:predicted nucleic acid-binding protein